MHIKVLLGRAAPSQTLPRAGVVERMHFSIPISASCCIEPQSTIRNQKSKMVGNARAPRPAT